MGKLWRLLIVSILMKMLPSYIEIPLHCNFLTLKTGGVSLAVLVQDKYKG